MYNTIYYFKIYIFRDILYLNSLPKFIHIMWTNVYFYNIKNELKNMPFGYEEYTMGMKRKEVELGVGMVQGNSSCYLLYRHYLKAFLQPGVNSHIFFCSNIIRGCFHSPYENVESEVHVS